MLKKNWDWRRREADKTGKKTEEKHSEKLPNMKEERREKRALSYNVVHMVRCLFPAKFAIY